MSDVEIKEASPDLRSSGNEPVNKINNPAADAHANMDEIPQNIVPFFRAFDDMRYQIGDPLSMERLSGSVIPFFKTFDDMCYWVVGSIPVITPSIEKEFEMFVRERRASWEPEEEQRFAYTVKKRFDISEKDTSGLLEEKRRQYIREILEYNSVLDEKNRLLLIKEGIDLRRVIERRRGIGAAFFGIGITAITFGITLWSSGVLSSAMIIGGGFGIGIGLYLLTV